MNTWRNWPTSADATPRENLDFKSMTPGTFIIKGRKFKGNEYYKDVEADYDDVIKWKHFPRYRPFVREILRSPVNSPH